MLPKPESCRGCPLEGDMQGFVPDELVEEAAVFILGQAPGYNEEREGTPFVGKTGFVMEKAYLPHAGLIRGASVSIGNVLKCRWIKNGKRTNDLPPAKILNVAATHCIQAHLNIPPGIKLVVAQGALAWKMMGGPGSITDWRGYLKPDE